MSELTVNEIREKVDTLVEWDRLMKEGKRIVDGLKAELQKEGTERLKQGVIKQVEFNGSGANRVVVTDSETVELVYHGIILNVFGDMADNLIEQDVSYKPKAGFKKLAQAVFNGQYGEKTKAEVIGELGVDVKTGKLLDKRLKGTIKKDMEAIEVILGFDAMLAEQLAIKIAEAIVYEQIVAIGGAAQKDFAEVVCAIRNAMIVDEKISLAVEYPQDKVKAPKAESKIEAA